ncbi:MAG: prolyl oligopeptidase family serine peptidase [Candidatus Cloacimonetes bacterium]|nr:prolyl oligopeptidase family serine peptidase [Candidatus Cloacimonadota bacterium]
MNRTAVIVIAILLVYVPIANAFATDNSPTWQQPSHTLTDILNRPNAPNISIMSKQNKLLSRRVEHFTPLEWLALEVARYGEIEIYAESRSKPRASYFSEISIADISDFDTSISYQRLNLPPNSAFGGEMYSHNQEAFLMFEYRSDKMVLWHVDTATLETKILMEGGLTQTMGNEAIWLPDNESVLINLIPDDIEKPEKASPVPTAPVVQETTGNTSNIRTFPNLLRNQEEEKLFEYYASSQLAILNTKTGQVQKISKSGVIQSRSLSPDGRFVLIREIVPPYSYSLPYFYFPAKSYVYEIATAKVFELANHPTRDLKVGWVPTGKRSIQWHPFEQSTLVYATALDGGNPDKKVTYRDELRALSFPFRGEGKSFCKTENRFTGIYFIDKDSYIYYDRVWENEDEYTYIVNKKGKKHLLHKEGRGQVYDLLGSAVSYPMPNGQDALLVIDESIYFIGDGLTETGRKPFIDKLSLDAFEKERLIELDDPDFYINIQNFYGKDTSKAVISKQNKYTPPNTSIIDIATKNTLLQLTENKDMVPEITNLQRRVIRYEREDGVQLSGVLYLPQNYDGTKRLPLLMSAYPREFADSSIASQSRHTENRYVRPFGSQNIYMCLDDIAVLENASFPVIGTLEDVNKTYLEQTISNAKAAIDYLDSQGIIDPDKVVIQGYSYGAFMVLNLLAHCDLFAGGIAQNGAYNRTLTPFGFQSERRTLWEAREDYLRLSPFLFVNQIEKPLLLIHSMADQNTGTFPLQSRRLFEAMLGNGKVCRFVQLPLEGHHYRAKESHLQVLSEFEAFFTKYIK